ncbi:hypothetical protein ACIQYF_19880 [Pseudomonas sp. NPDC096917]|uniref:hypothetical protein n=1 Tax=Pseudomonas sp. NPDC096917 TaxID=3364483 RepID=UPI00383A971B
MYQSLVTKTLPEPPAALPSSQQLHQYVSHEQLSRNLAMSGKIINYSHLPMFDGFVPDLAKDLCTQTVHGYQAGCSNYVRMPGGNTPDTA